MNTNKRQKTTNKGASSSTHFRRKTVSGIDFVDADHLARFEKLKDRHIDPTLYFCEATVEKLGLTEDLQFMFRNVGWDRFINIKEHTYRNLTLEFLSSLVVSLEKLDPSRYYGAITFRLGGQPRSLSISELNEIFGFPNIGGKLPPDGYDRNRFWDHIADGFEHFHPQKAKASLLRNPCLRYAHKVMAHTIFARGDTGGLRADELALLWCMVHPDTLSYNCGLLLALQLKSVANQNSGGIAIGGIITTIARHFRVQLQGEIIRSSERIDMAYLVHARIIDTVGGGYMYQTTNFEYSLPDSSATTVTTQQGLIFRGYDERGEANNNGEEEIENEEDGGGDHEDHSVPPLDALPVAVRGQDVWEAINGLRQDIQNLYTLQLEFQQRMDQRMDQIFRQFDSSKLGSGPSPPNQPSPSGDGLL